MERPVLIVFCLIAATAASSAEWADCYDRLEVRATPKLPTSLSAVHALREGRCVVNVVFDLLENGTPDSVTAQAADERCEVFKESAIQSVLESKFKAGEKTKHCRILHIVEYEDE